MPAIIYHEDPTQRLPMQCWSIFKHRLGMTIARTSKGDIEVDGSKFFLGPRSDKEIAFRVDELELARYGTAFGTQSKAVERPPWARQSTDPYDIDCDICQNALGNMPPCPNSFLCSVLGSQVSKVCCLEGCQHNFHLFCLMKTMLPTVCRRLQTTTDDLRLSCPLCGEETELLLHNVWGSDPLMATRISVLRMIADSPIDYESNCILCGSTNKTRQPISFYSMITCAHCKWSYCTSCEAHSVNRHVNTSELRLCYRCFLGHAPPEDKALHFHPNSKSFIDRMQTPHCMCSGCKTVLQRVGGCNQLSCPVCDLHTCCLCNLTDYDIDFHYCSSQFGCSRFMDLLDISYLCEEGVCHGESFQQGRQFVWECSKPEHRQGRQKLLKETQRRMHNSIE